jgi:hypothetical protein
MTNEELEQLRAWAHDNRRSLQKEVIYRVFTQHAVTEIDADEFEAAKKNPEWRAFTKAADNYVAETGTHFKPDFGKKL